jgi:hypothetical protein
MAAGQDGEPATEPWPLQPAEDVRAREDEARWARLAQRRRGQERAERARRRHATDAEAALSDVLLRLADEAPTPRAGPDPTKPRLTLRVAGDDGRRYAVLTLSVANHAGDDLVVEARKRIDEA